MENILGELDYHYLQATWPLQVQCKLKKQTLDTKYVLANWLYLG